MFPAQYLFADTGRSVHRSEKIVQEHYDLYSMNNYEHYFHLRIMYTVIFYKSSTHGQICAFKKIFL